jgi:hypothetical protein
MNYEKKGRYFLRFRVVFQSWELELYEKKESLGGEFTPILQFIFFPFLVDLKTAALVFLLNWFTDLTYQDL